MKRAACAALLSIACAQAWAQDGSLADAWSYRAAIYGWFPDARATANVALPTGTVPSLDTSAGSYLSNLDFAFMATVEARKGAWSLTADVVYADFGKPLTAPVPVDANLDFSALAATVVAGYALAPWLDVVGGARYLQVDSTIDYSMALPVPATGSVGVRKDYWDGVIGVRGRAGIARDWFATYYADAGAGSKQTTWQAFAGLGYRFAWGDVMAGYRYLAYDFDDSEAIGSVRLGGPIAGVAFRF